MIDYEPSEKNVWEIDEVLCMYRVLSGSEEFDWLTWQKQHSMMARMAYALREYKLNIIAAYIAVASMVFLYLAVATCSLLVAVLHGKTSAVIATAVVLAFLLIVLNDKLKYFLDSSRRNRDAWMKSQTELWQFFADVYEMACCVKGSSIGSPEELEKILLGCKWQNYRSIPDHVVDACGRNLQEKARAVKSLQATPGNIYQKNAILLTKEKLRENLERFKRLKIIDQSVGPEHYYNLADSHPTVAE